MHDRTTELDHLERLAELEAHRTATATYSDPVARELEVLELAVDRARMGDVSLLNELQGD